MALSNYGELCTALANLLDRDDLATAIPDFVRLCETSVDGRADLAQHRRRICRATALISHEYESVPPNYLSVQSIDLQTPAVSLQYVDPDNITRMKSEETAWRANISQELCGVYPAPPTFYSIVGTEFRFFPAPQQTYTALLNVYERLPALSSSGTNWLLQFYPSIYLYGSAIHSAPYLRDDARLTVWNGLYEQACEQAARADPTETDRSTLRTEVAAMHVHRHRLGMDWR